MGKREGKGETGRENLVGEVGEVGELSLPSRPSANDVPRQAGKKKNRAEGNRTTTTICGALCRFLEGGWWEMRKIAKRTPNAQQRLSVQEIHIHGSRFFTIFAYVRPSVVYPACSSYIPSL